MKKIILLFFISVLTFLMIIPSYSLSLPSTDGSYMPPPTPDGNALTATYSIIRAYSDVSSVFIDFDMIPASAKVDGENLDYYPTYMFCTPDTIVAPNEYGFGNISNYLSLQSFRHSISYYDLNDYGGTVSYPNTAPIPTLVDNLNPANTIVYSFPLYNRTMNYAYQYGVVTGEWLNGSSTDSIVTGYSIKWNANAPMTVTLIGSLSYGYEGEIIQTVNLDRSYNVPAGATFDFNPQNLLQYEDTINFDYYVFIGNWTCYSSTSSYLIEYKAYDLVNAEMVDYLNGYNEYVDQDYSNALYPIQRITSKLAFTRQSDSGSLNVTIEENGPYTYDVSDYSQIQIAVDVPQEVLEDINAFNWLYGAVNGFLQMEILPGFSLGGILLFIAGLALLIWILKIFLGG